VSERAAPDAGRHERAHRVLVVIALGDDLRSQLVRQGVDFEMRGRSFHFVDDAADVSGRKGVQPGRQRATIGSRPLRGGDQAIQRAILAKEQDLVLAGEVVIQVGGRDVGGDGNVAHPGGRKTAAAEDAGGGAQDGDPLPLGAAFGRSRTAVRDSNHRSKCNPKRG
jgi:hypothetical protein